jgi:aminoglycoside phosphotransferase (APT) family kinase protein
VTVDADLPGRLLQVLRAVTAIPGLAYAEPPRPLTGGFWAELFTFSLASPPPGWPRELVARLMPDAALARKETIVQAVVASAGFPTPVVRASGGPQDGLGRAFMVMDRAPGAPPLAGLAGAGAIASAIGALRQIPGLLAAPMAQLHALDAQPVRGQLGPACGVPVTIPGMLAGLQEAAAGYPRADLVAAAQWLAGHPPPPAPEVICHGDLHPFNLLIDGAKVTVLDWSAALLASRAYDVAFTSLILAEPPLVVPRAVRPAVRRAGAGLARRFIARYQQAAGVQIGTGELAWHQGVVCLRALIEVAGWAQQEGLDARAGHPWLVSGPAFARRLAALTGADVRMPWAGEPPERPAAPARAKVGARPRRRLGRPGN